MKESQRRPRYGNLARLSEDRRKAQNAYEEWQKKDVEMARQGKCQEERLHEFDKMHRSVCEHGKRQRSWWRKEGRRISWSEGRNDDRA